MRSVAQIGNEMGVSPATASASASGGRFSWALLRRAAFDGLAWAVALEVAVVLRYEFRPAESQLLDATVVIPFAIAMQWILGYFTGVYRGRWRSGSFDELPALALTVGGTTALLAIVDFTRPLRPLPASSVIVGGFLAFVFMGGMRSFWRRAAARWRHPSSAGARRVLVFGAGIGGERAVVAMHGDPDSPYVPVAFLDDDAQKTGLTIQGVTVVGNREGLAAAAEEHDATVLLIALPSADSGLVRDLMKRADEAGLEVCTLPSVRELLHGQVRVVDIREPNEADVLGRIHADIDITAASAYLRGKVVAVTGAGGSIGSELCQQVASCEPAELILIDRDESALHSLQLALSGRALLDSDDLALLDIRDRARVAKLFVDRRPDVVFHAAALKHLPLLESHPAEALKTNVWGSRSVLDAAVEAGVERFVNISTDKAANPCSVLGYSKRICEGLTAYYAQLTGQPYLSVRFGNVLMSRGSVLTAFRAQIEAGGPITVTDPEVSRYFMVVQEAVELVLQAGGIGQGGHALVLDMGDPVRIADVARRMAEHSNPPIPIEFTGLRPGEKVSEELFSCGEVGQPTQHELIRSVDVPALDPVLVVDIDPTLKRRELTAILADLCTEMEDREQVSRLPHVPPSMLQAG
jgi:FlaA1/EpsC-like NDP-sugar epimerase